jgi:hypothetical protein
VAAVAAAVAAVGWAAYRLWRSVALDMLSTEAVLYARMARLCYSEPEARRCSVLERAGFVLDTSCSSMRAAVFYRVQYIFTAAFAECIHSLFGRVYSQPLGLLTASHGVSVLSTFNRPRIEHWCLHSEAQQAAPSHW